MDLIAFSALIETNKTNQQDLRGENVYRQTWGLLQIDCKEKESCIDGTLFWGDRIERNAGDREWIDYCQRTSLFSFNWPETLISKKQ
jgi:hypothetical protein